MAREGKPDLLTVADALRLDRASLIALYQRHVHPRLTLFRALGLERVVVDRAEDMYYLDRDGRPILDFFGGFGALALGHNHPRIVRVRELFQREQRHELGMPFLSQYATVLAHDLAMITECELDRALLYSTGSEAVEAALKLAERAQPRTRGGVVHAAGSFHGKTIGALSVTDSALYRARFALPGRRYRVPFGDVAALADTLRAHRDIGVVILEPVQGGAGVRVPPAGYLQQVRRLCDEHGVLWIADEVQCGMGRTGRFFAFEHAGVSPDVVTLAKSLGGGKAAIAAVLTRGALHDRAYGSARTSLIHGPATFSGMGEACCTAIETLHVLYDEGLLENAAAQGAYLLRRLEALRRRHPRLIRQVRGQGLLVGIEFARPSVCFPRALRPLAGVFDGVLRGGLAGLVGRQLLAEYGIVVAFTEYNRDVIRLEPPLTVRRAHVDALVTALDAVLTRGPGELAASYLRTGAGRGLGKNRAKSLSACLGSC